MKRLVINWVDRNEPLQRRSLAVPRSDHEGRCGETKMSGNNSLATNEPKQIKVAKTNSALNAPEKPTSMVPSIIAPCMNIVCGGARRRRLLANERSLRSEPFTGQSTRHIATPENDYSESKCEIGSGVPSLLFKAPVDNEAVEPIKQLMIAMLNHAFRCYQTSLHTQKISQLQAFLKAEEWLFGTQSSDPF